MGATVQDVAYAALAAVGRSDSVALAGRWVNERYQQLAARTRFRHLRQAGSLTIPAVITAGTVTTVVDSPVVTGDATAAAAWSPACRGRFFRARAAWYKIADVTGTQMTLESPWSEDAVTAASYKVVARYVPLPVGTRYFRSFTLARLWKPLDVMNLAELEAYVPNRPFWTAFPQLVADVGEDPETHARLIEFYPYSTRAELITFIWWRKPPTLELDEQLPGVLDPYILKEGVLIDLYRRAMMDAAMKGDVNAAQMLSNEARRQETSWNRILLDAAKQDRGTDDQTAMLRMLRLGPVGRADITNAAQEIYSQGSRP